MSSLALFIALFSITILGASAALDSTLIPNEKGADVVEAVVDKIRSRCVLPDDRFLLRRLAYVESEDGLLADTFRTGYNGGIWKINFDDFLVTLSCTGAMTEICARIKTAFEIDWPQVRWAELRKPLYSGLAATLHVVNGNRGIPRDKEAQADFWVRYYRYNEGRDRKEFLDGVKKVQDMGGCSDQLDLVFILDGSGSIDPLEFKQVLDFVVNITEDFTIGREHVQVGVVEFSNVVGDIIFLDDYLNKTDLQNAIRGVRKTGMKTNTAAAIRAGTRSVFSANQGARPNAKRVLILLTDGASGNVQETIDAAQQAKQAGIVLFTVGVGSVNQHELRAVASSPNCTHFFMLRDFGEIAGLVHDIRKKSCRAPKVISTTDSGDPDAPPTHVTNPLKDGENVTNTFVIRPDGKNGTDKVIETKVDCGILNIYASYNTQNPGPAFYDVMDQVTDDNPSIIRVNATSQGRPLYVTVIGTKLPSGSADVLKCLGAGFNVSVVDAPESTVTQIVCRVGGTERPCTLDDLRNAGYTGQQCPTTTTTPEIVIANPCTATAIAADNLVHAHPTDVDKFIVCDVTGNMYVTSCPRNGIYRPETKTCNNQAIFTLARQKTTSDDIDLLCLRANLHLPHPTDATKFLHCLDQNVAEVKDCNEGLLWNDDIKSCDQKGTKTVSGTIPNPCGTGGGLYPHPWDDQKYVHCTSAEFYDIMICPSGLVFNSALGVCDWSKGK